MSNHAKHALRTLLVFAIVALGNSMVLAQHDQHHTGGGNPAMSNQQMQDMGKHMQNMQNMMSQMGQMMDKSNKMMSLMHVGMAQEHPVMGHDATGSGMMGMMDGVNQMGKDMTGVLEQMNTIMKDKESMSKDGMKEHMEVMVGSMSTMMKEYKGMLRAIEQIQDAESTK